jgi:hypothetical protein
MKTAIFFLWATVCAHVACAQDTLSAKQLIPNPAFQVTVNELAMGRALQKLGYSDMMMIPADKLPQILAKLDKDSTTHSKVNGWTFWHNLAEKTTQARSSEAIKYEHKRGYVYLDVGKPQFFGTYLNEALEAGKTYKLVFQYYQPESLQALPTHAFTLGFAFLDDSPTNIDKAIQPQKKHTFLPNKDAKDYAKRQKVIKEYQREYGGNFENKTWLDFQGKKATGDRYTTVTLAYKAKGGERYLAMGNFAVPRRQGLPAIRLTCHRLYLYEQEKNSTKD